MRQKLPLLVLALLAAPFAAPRAFAQNPFPSALQVPPSASASGAPAAPGDGRPKETAGQKDRRLAYVNRTLTEIKAAVHANGKAVTNEEREAIRRHWRHAMRLFRVREIAEDLNDAATVTRVDADLTNLDSAFFARLRLENTRAPKAGAGK